MIRDIDRPENNVLKSTFIKPSKVTTTFIKALLNYFFPPFIKTDLTIVKYISMNINRLIRHYKKMKTTIFYFSKMVLYSLLKPIWSLSKKNREFWMLGTTFRKLKNIFTNINTIIWSKKMKKAYNNEIWQFKAPHF